MQQYQSGDRVRVVVPDTDSPDHRYHDETGVVTAVFEDDLSAVTGDPRDDYLYRVAFDAPVLGSMTFRYGALRPAV